MKGYASYGDISVTVCGGKAIIDYAGQAKIIFCRISDETEYSFDKENNILTVGKTVFRVNRFGVTVITALELKGSVAFGECYAVTSEKSRYVRCAIGNAVRQGDKMLYNNSTDSALVFDGNVTIEYDNGYSLILKDFCAITFKENILAEGFGIEYGKVNKKATFSKPPAGWMTWYALKFDTCEKSVLENLEFQEKHFKKYGADAFWIDWEWYHKDMKGLRDDGADTFHPDKEKYPHGLHFISDKIKQAGFTPCLWLGVTNDVAENEYAKENPEIVLVNKNTWCGSYFYDFSHPKYLNEFLPKALHQVGEWGYEAIKFDTIPNSLIYHEEYHSDMYDPSLTTKEAFRNVIKKVRQELGENMYMLSCAATRDEDLLWAADLFDAARVGDDIFKWEEFVENGINRTLKFLPLHNNVLYADADNVVLKEEYNTLEQARARITFVALLGLPMTFGDDLKALDEARIDLICRSLPVMDIHPCNIMPCDVAGGELVIDLAVSLPFEKYTIVGVINLEDAEKAVKIDISELGLCGEYHIFDYKSEEYKGTVSDSFDIKLAPFETLVFSLRKKSGELQLLSTSRHITQGAAEIKALEQTTAGIHMTSELVEKDEYRIYLYLPNGKKLITTNSAEKIGENVYKVTFLPAKSGIYDFTFSQE